METHTEILEPFLDINLYDRRYCFRMPLVDSRGYFIMVWEIVMLVLSLWVAWTVPFSMTFLQNNASPTGDAFVLGNTIATDVLFWTDLLLNFCTTYTDLETGEEVKEHKRIAKNYVLHGTFFIDLVACIPFYVLEDVMPSGFSSGTRLTRLLRLTRLTKLLTKMKATQSVKNSIKLVQMIIYLILMRHWISCIWYTVIYIDQNWHPFRIPAEDFYDESVWLQYSFSFFIASDLNEQANEIFPTSELEIAVTTTIVLGGVIFSTIIYGLMLVMIERNMRNSNEASEQLDVVIDIMDALKLPPDLQRRVNEFVEKAESMNTQTRVWQNFVSCLPHSIYKEISVLIFRDLLGKCDFLTSMDSNVLGTFVERLQPHLYKPEEVIIMQGSPGDRFYIVCSGKVQTYLESLTFHNESRGILSEPLEILEAGSAFGLSGIVTLVGRYSYSVKGMNHTTLVSLSKADFHEITSSYPNFAIELERQSKQTHVVHKAMYRHFFRQVPYLNQLREDNDIYEVSVAVKRRFVPAGKVLSLKGSFLNEVFYVEAGSLALTFPCSRYRKLKLLELPAGSVYGLFSIFTKSPQVVQLEATENSTIQSLTIEDLVKMSSKISLFRQNLLSYGSSVRDDFIIAAKTAENIRINSLTSGNDWRNSVISTVIMRKTPAINPDARVKLLSVVMRIIRGLFPMGFLNGHRFFVKNTRRSALLSVGSKTESEEQQLIIDLSKAQRKLGMKLMRLKQESSRYKERIEALKATLLS
jgi:CRP-like cAMP-binding protein